MLHDQSTITLSELSYHPSADTCCLHDAVCMKINGVKLDLTACSAQCPRDWCRARAAHALHICLSWLCCNQTTTLAMHAALMRPS